MFSVIRSHGVRFAISREAVPLVVAMAAAETLYKFHSFTLECLAFLATWFVLSGAWNLAYVTLSRARQGAESRP